ncbi:glycoside hydrolase family 26 protein [Actinomadura kijaniata]|uniref:glycoside hydrolase family 26 protein n=1 Tax=Actinomadura kijaniata TaxID=46161 RepID=UPI003F1A93A9
MVHGGSRTAALSLRTAGAALAALTAAGCGGGAVATPKITTTVKAGVAPVPPAKGAYFGAWAPTVEDGGASYPGPSASPSPSGAPGHKPGRPEKAGTAGMAAVLGFERQLGRKLDIAHTYHSWKSEFPDATDKEILAGDRYLLLTWAGADTKEIVSGKHDALLRERARAVRATGKPVFLRWQRGMDTTGRQAKVHSPADFVAAWKHVRGVFAGERADNVAWVWCPTAGGFTPGTAQSFYPGDDQVDWICADAQPGSTYEYRDISETLEMFLEWARQRPRPIMIAEFGVPQSYGERRAEWLRKAARTFQDPQVKAVVYFNSNEQAEDRRDKRRSYTVNGDKRAVSALRELATVPYFNPRNLPVTSG